MKVKELIEELEILNPKKTVHGSVEFQNMSHVAFTIDRIDISTGKIQLVLKP